MRLAALLLAAAVSTAPVAVVAQQVSTAPAASQPDDDDQRIRCRRIPVTGSLVRVERVCKTVAEWRRLSERGNDVVRQQHENGLICTGGECRGG